jgi:hypothetical protein
MKTSNKILLIALTVLIGILLAGMITARKLIFSSSIQGDGNITQTTLDIPNFEKVSVRGNIRVYYTQTENTSLVLRTDANLMEYVTTEVRNNELIIKTTGNIRPSSHIEVELSNPYLTNIEAHASARFDTQSSIEADYMSLVANAGATMDIQGVFNRLSVNQNAGAKINLAGEAQTLDVSSNAGGTVNAFDMVAQRAKAEANAGASINVNAHELDASANAGGSINYTGEPSMTNIRTSAGGNIRKR